MAKYHNSPVIGDGGYNLIPEDEVKYVAIEKELRKMAEHPPDLHCMDTELLEGRIDDFFDLYASYGLKPPVAGLAMALGVSRKMLWAIVNDAAVGGNGYKANLPRSVTHVIKNAYESLEIRWEMYMMHGKVNPVTGIFLGKNQFGYKDQTEVVIPQSQTPEVDAEEIKRRYLNGEVEENDQNNSVFGGEVEESGQIALDNMDLE
ncbi:MAG: DNA-packaging protein [Clostridia bacterium]|nr:DNA-packaging protein [Clostridia bacterium]